MHSKDGSIEYICSAIYTAGAESAPNSQSTNNDNKQRKQERVRARYATMSQEEKNVRNLRLREACQKKKGDWSISFPGFAYRFLFQVAGDNTDAERKE